MFIDATDKWQLTTDNWQPSIPSHSLQYKEQYYYKLDQWRTSAADPYTFGPLTNIVFKNQFKNTSHFSPTYINIH